MPWEITIRSADGPALGDVAAVREKFANALPAIQFHVEPSGPDAIAAARAMGIEFPDIIRKHMENRPAKLQAEFEGGEFVMQFYGFESQPIEVIYGEVRGAGNPLPALAALCNSNGWIAIECATGRPIDLAGRAAAGWERFQSYCDRAVRSILKSEERP